MKIIWHNRAKQDLNNHIHFIAQQSQGNALKVLENLLKLVEILELFPYAYPKEPVYDDDTVRFIAKWSFKIIYKIDAEVVYILKVFNTKQNPNKVLK